MENLLPVLDLDTLQQRTNEAAMKSALQAIEEFYTGYSSPYKKAITEKLELVALVGGIELPDIIALINEKLGKEIDEIANTAVGKTFLPMVSDLILRQPKEVKFSDILKEFIKAYDLSEEDEYSASVEIEPSGIGSWITAVISCSDHQHKIVLHTFSFLDKEGNPKRQILSLPNKYNSGFNSCDKKMKLILPEERAELELPFIPSVFNDNFLRYIASLIISKSAIEMDCTDFEENMFSQNDEY